MKRSFQDSGFGIQGKHNPSLRGGRKADVAIQSAARLRGKRFSCAADAAQLDCFAPLAMTTFFAEVA